ncbi:rop-interactive crib motif-containing protein 4 [Musa troglodytarum]|uniref:Rop-interactive crib motif-containing protein 4 n=1 Tax=Musa troglodytarum TaxID=320322 RepID=A0A9E7I939_9LILI|nr:rop-interactive crib motif-containing protein 4 [Musa troglodytarum]
MSQRSRGKTAVPESKAKIWEDLACLEGPQEPYWSLQMARMLLVVTVIIGLLDLVWLVLGVQGRKGRQQASSWPPREVKAAKAAEADTVPDTRRKLGADVRSSSAALAFPKPSISAGFQKLVKSLKSLSQHAVSYRDDDDEVEMEIGFPTDVQHVAHIGCDGFLDSMSGNKNWDRAPPELLPLPSPTHQFELAVAAQAGAPPPRASWPQ